MNERAPRVPAKDRLSRATKGFVIDRVVLPEDDDYVAMPGETRSEAEQEPYLLFSHPKQTNRSYAHSLSGGGENAFLEVMGVSRSRIYTREKAHEAYQSGFDVGYEAGRQSANNEIARLRADIDDLRGQFDGLLQQVVELTDALAAANGEPETAVPPTEPTEAAVVAPAEEATAAEVPPADAEAAPVPPPETDQPDEEPETATNEPPQQGRVRRLRDRATIATGNILTGSRSTEVRETNHRGRTVGALAVAAVVGAVVWEILEHKAFGHSSSRELRHHYQDQITQLRVQESKDHLEQVKLSAAEIKVQSALVNEVTANHAQDVANHTAEMNAIAANKAQIMTKLAADHNSDLKAIHGVLKQVHEINVHEHSEAIGAYSHHHETAKAVNTSLKYRGDTVWHEVSNRLKSRFGHNASKSQIAQATGRVLKLNGLRWSGGGSGVDAHKLPVGFQFKIPANIAQMFKK